MAFVVVAGAGPAGLLTALMLGRLGHEVLVCDPLPSDPRVGRRELLQPCGHRALDMAGLAVGLLADPEAEIAPCSWMRCFLAGGQPAFEADLRRLPPPYNEAWLYRTGALARRLRAQLPPSALRLGAALVYLRPQGRRVRVRLSDGSEWAADLVVAADGAGSTVRTLSGCVARVRSFPGRYFLFHTELEAALPVGQAQQYLGRRSVGLVPLSDDRAYVWAHVPEDDDEVRWRHEIGGTCPLLDDAGWPRWSHGVMLRAVEVHCPRWWAPGVVLIGDSAHALHPHGAMGTNLGLEDAVELARCARILGTVDAAALGPEFQRARQPKIAALATLARQRAWSWDSAAPWVLALAVRSGRKVACAPQDLQERALRFVCGLADRGLSGGDVLRLVL